MKYSVFITSLMCLSMLSTSLSVSAMTPPFAEINPDQLSESKSDFISVGEGYIQQAELMPFCGFLIVTDGTVPTMEDFSEYDNFFTIEPAYYEIADDLELSQDSLYMVSFSSYEGLVNTARKLSLSEDWIEDVLFYRDVQTYSCEIANYALNITTEYPEELASLAEVEKVIELTDSSFTHRIVFTETALGENQNDRTRLYADYEKLVQLTEKINNEYGAQMISYYEPVITSMDFSGDSTYSVSDVWAYFGDSNADNIVNAEDASQILLYSAAEGTGESNFSISILASDVNMDTNVDSLDASIILQYAAENGSGTFTGTFEEYVNR